MTTIKCTDTLRPDYYTMARDNLLTAQIQWDKYISDLVTKVQAGEPVYVSFRDARRKGSIGKIVELNVEDQKYCKHMSWGYSRTAADYAHIPTIQDLKVGFDDRKNIINCSTYDVELVLDRDPSEGTVYVFTQPDKKKKEPPKIVYDRIGEPVTPGDFVSFVYRSYGHISLKFGTITRITDKGTVFVQTLKLKDGDRSEELRCNQDNVVIVNDQLMKRLVMAKLAAN